MVMAILFFVLCIAASAMIAILLRDSFTVSKLRDYVAIVDQHGSSSTEEYNFRMHSSLYELLTLLRHARVEWYTHGRADQAAFEAAANESVQRKGLESVLTKVVKSKRSSRSSNGKNKK